MGPSFRWDDVADVSESAPPPLPSFQRTLESIV